MTLPKEDYQMMAKGFWEIEKDIQADAKLRKLHNYYKATCYDNSFAGYSDEFIEDWCKDFVEKLKQVPDNRKMTHVNYDLSLEDVKNLAGDRISFRAREIVNIEKGIIKHGFHDGKFVKAKYEATPLFPEYEMTPLYAKHIVESCYRHKQTDYDERILFARMAHANSPKMDIKVYARATMISNEEARKIRVTTDPNIKGYVVRRSDGSDVCVLPQDFLHSSIYSTDNLAESYARNADAATEEIYTAATENASEKVKNINDTLISNISEYSIPPLSSIEAETVKNILTDMYFEHIFDEVTKKATELSKNSEYSRPFADI